LGKWYLEQECRAGGQGKAGGGVVYEQHMTEDGWAYLLIISDNAMRRYLSLLSGSFFLVREEKKEKRKKGEACNRRVGGLNELGPGRGDNKSNPERRQRRPASPFCFWRAGPGYCGNATDRCGRSGGPRAGGKAGPRKTSTSRRGPVRGHEVQVALCGRGVDRGWGGLPTKEARDDREAPWNTSRRLVAESPVAVAARSTQPAARLQRVTGWCVSSACKAGRALGLGGRVARGGLGDGE
jgi:hypothetical protein